MKNKISFWTVFTIVIILAIAIVSKNPPAAVFIGSGTSMLLMIISNLEVDKKIRN